MGKRPIIAIILALWIGTSANGQNSGQACATLPEDAKRLHCYDAIFRTNTIESAKGAWQIKEDISKIDDSKNVIAILESAETIRGPYGQANKAVMFIRCAEKKTSLYFTFADHFMASIESYGVITYRIDKNPAQKRAFHESTDHKALGLWSASEAIPFIRQLYGGNVLFVQTTPFNQSSVTAEFQIAGGRDTLEPVRAACGWSTAAKPAPR